MYFPDPNEAPVEPAPDKAAPVEDGVLFETFAHYVEAEPARPTAGDARP